MGSELTPDSVEIGDCESSGGEYWSKESRFAWRIASPRVH